MDNCWFCEQKTKLLESIYYKGRKVSFHSSCFEECADLKLENKRNHCACCSMDTVDKHISIVDGDRVYEFIQEHFENIVGQDLLKRMIQETSGNL